MDSVEGTNSASKKSLFELTGFPDFARMALDTGSVRIDPEEPFTWASGYRMPIYNDNRRLLGHWKYRLGVAVAMQSALASVKASVIAGTATAGIPPATTLADLMELPLVYVRGAAKTHGMQNRVEGRLEPGQKVILVEDLVSTGGSALSAVEALRTAGGVVEHCICIFNYGFEKAAVAFKDAGCRLHSLLTYPQLIESMRKEGQLDDDRFRLLMSWYKSPFEWGERHGFPRRSQT